METGGGEFIPTTSRCPEDCIECGNGALYTNDNKQHSEFGSCCSSLGVINNEFNNIIGQRQCFTSSTKQLYNEGRMMSGSHFGNNGLLNFGYSYNPQSFTDSINSYHNYDRPYPIQRHDHSQYFDNSTGSFRLRNIRKRRPMGHYQDSIFNHSFSGSGISSSYYMDGSSTCSSSMYGSSNDNGICNFKKRKNVGLLGSTRSNSITCSLCSLRSSSSRLPLSKNKEVFKVGICPSFLFNNHCINFPDCNLSHSRSDFEDMSLSSSEGQLLQDLVIPTEECKHFSVAGKCPVGLSCNFIHKMPKKESELKNEQTTIAHSDDVSPDSPDEDIFHEFFLDNNDDDINQCCDIDKVYIDDKF